MEEAKEDDLMKGKKENDWNRKAFSDKIFLCVLFFHIFRMFFFAGAGNHLPYGHLSCNSSTAACQLRSSLRADVA
jgi:hypothetical protein